MPHADDRGSLVEAWREDWGVGPRVVQWNVVPSRSGTLRGMHVHAGHDDYYMVASGKVTVGLHDLRRGSETRGLSSMLEMRGQTPKGLVIPRGVVHGFLSGTASVTLYGVSGFYDPSDEMGCRWDDPGLRLRWPGPPKHLSERDTAAGTLAQLRRVYERRARCYARGAPSSARDQEAAR